MILVIDNYDSFTYNIVQYLGQCGAEVVVRRNDEITLEEIEALHPSGILLSPGPCTPNESGICTDIVSKAMSGWLPGVPVFGVCLGHQVIGHVSGGTVTRAHVPRHGKSSMIEHDGRGVFEGLPSPFQAIRYHSLIIQEDTLPSDYEVTARSVDDNLIMGVRHKQLPIEGVQFHPESILTEGGMRIIENFLKRVAFEP